MTELAATFRRSALDRYFKFAENGTTLGRDTMAGGAASSSSATTYIESGAGVGAGGRTGWVAVVCGALFPFMFLAPLIGMVPLQAVAPALIIVGYLMVTALSEYEEEAEPGGDRTTTRRAAAGIDFNNLALGLAALLTIVIMPFTYSITNGIGFGFIAYTVIRIAQGDWRRIHPLLYAVSAGFVLYFLVPLLQDNLSWV
jgi:AGZA family xanthine/uracil permease-like MFS transporter